MVTAARVALAGEPHWRVHAACRRFDSELWFPVARKDPSVEARQVCKHCPVRRRCGGWAFATGQEFGIWAGYRLDSAAGRRGIRAEFDPDAEPPEQVACEFCGAMMVGSVCWGCTHGCVDAEPVRRHLLALRDARPDVSQVARAEACGLSPRSIAAIERGARRFVKAEYAAAISAVTVEQFERPS